MSNFDYEDGPLVGCLRQYPKDVPNLGYNAQYLMREAAEGPIGQATGQTGLFNECKRHQTEHGQQAAEIERLKQEVKYAEKALENKHNSASALVEVERLNALVLELQNALRARA